MLILVVSSMENINIVVEFRHPIYLRKGPEVGILGRWWRIYSDISTKAGQIAQSSPSHKTTSSQTQWTPFPDCYFFVFATFWAFLALGNFPVIYLKWEIVISWRVNAGKSWRLFNFPQLSLLSNYSIKIFSPCQNCLPKLFSTSLKNYECSKRH